MHTMLTRAFRSATAACSIGVPGADSSATGTEGVEEALIPGDSALCGGTVSALNGTFPSGSGSVDDATPVLAEKEGRDKVGSVRSGMIARVGTGAVGIGSTETLACERIRSRRPRPKRMARSISTALPEKVGSGISSVSALYQTGYFLLGFVCIAGLV